MGENLYSYHVFMFPFQWQIVGAEMRNKKMEERTCLPEFVKHFNPAFWKRKPYVADTVLKYNEYNYFYGMARDVMFDDGKPLDETIIANLFYDIEPDTFTFDIVLSDWNGNQKKYSLHIDSIILHLYSTGVGVLSFHLNNRLQSQKDPESILDINQAGRRLYPPFFGVELNNVGKQKQYENKDFAYGINITNKCELPSSLSLISDYNYEDFQAYKNSDHFLSNPFQLPKHIAFLFDGVPVTVDKKDYNSKERKIFITPSLDDRMYVVCWYGNKEKAEQISELTRQRGDELPDMNKNSLDWWYRYLYNDQSTATCQDDTMKWDQIKKQTYWRWTGKGYHTFFGVSRYSFVCLTSTLDDLKNSGAAFIVNHMQTMYYKMAELCLVQRACLLRFSEEVTGISSMKEDKKSIPIAERVGNLYKQYIRFVNRIHFREVTAQEQGIEMYEMMQKCMKIPENVKDLDKEIHELYEYVTLEQEQKQNKSIELLTIIGAIFIFPAIIFGFFDMSVFPQAETFNWINIVPFMGIIGLIPFIYLIFHNRGNKKWLFIIISSTIILLFILFTVIKFFLIFNFNT